MTDDDKAKNRPQKRAADPEEAARTRQNIAAGIAVLVITVAVVWVMNQLQSSSRNLMCMEAGHRNCVPLDIERTRTN